MRKADWTVIDNESPSEAAARLHDNITKILDRCLPWKNYKVRSTDDPWIDEPTRKKIKQRKNVFSNGRKRTKDWRELKAITNNMIKTRKKAYFEKECNKLKEKGAHLVPYKALKSLGAAEKPPQFDPRSLRPHLTEEELLEEMADFFGSISAEFEPVDMAALPTTFDNVKRVVTAQEVLDRLQAMQKPKSAITIDPPSRFVNQHADLFGPILAHIVNLVLRGGAWPEIWQREEVSVIPKSNNVEDLDGCRNISCTSIFSKLCESFMMDCIHEEVTLTGPQFGLSLIHI